MKKCSKCKKVKKLSEFSKRTLSCDGHASQCKLCRKKKYHRPEAKAWRWEYDQKPKVKARRKERRREYVKSPKYKVKRWEYNHRPEVIARCKEIRDMRLVTHEQKDSQRNAIFKRKYGISLEQYRAIFTKQNGACSICGLPETKRNNGKPRRLSVDHCHTTNKIRGLLCNKCNLAIGNFEDDIDVMASAISYLRQSG
ncbi:hypothetical protein LCGC14_1036850 [marine sediment metagenome]|uniref:Recombination endonuclease VII n=1 Tax=marine sediment metagenome TaxID=412755 RepID=A0A0F9NEL4_9ZZZZ